MPIREFKAPAPVASSHLQHRIPDNTCPPSSRSTPTSISSASSSSKSPLALTKALLNSTELSGQEMSETGFERRRARLESADTGQDMSSDGGDEGEEEEQAEEVEEDERPEDSEEESWDDMPVVHGMLYF